MKALSGKRIVITRAKYRAGDLVERLRALGADVFEFATIAIEPITPDPPLGDLGSYDWVLLTSVNAAERFFEIANEALQHAPGIQFAVVGPATARAVEKHGAHVALMPEKHVAEGLLTAIIEREPCLEGKRFLFPCSDIARDVLPNELRRHGAEVSELVVYRTVLPQASATLVNDLLAFRPDAVVFTSPSTVRNFCELIGPARLEQVKRSAVFASIGPVTTQALNELGLVVGIEPETHSVAGLVEALIAFTG